MSLQDELKAKALALIHQQMANWVVEIQRQIARQQEDFVRALDILQENAAKYDERIDESAIEAAIAETLALQPAAPAGAGGDRLKASIEAVEKGTSLSEVLMYLVNEVSQYVERAAMFIIKGNNAIGWYARGVEPPELVKQINIPLNADTVFRIVHNSRHALSGHIAHSPGTMQAIARLGGTPQGILTVPLILRDKIAAILFCDTTREQIPVGDAGMIEILVLFASKVIDLISLGPKVAGAPRAASGTAMDRAAAMRAPAAERPMTPAPGGFTPVPQMSEEGAATVMFRGPVASALKHQVAGITAHTPIPTATPPPPAPARPAISPDEQKAHEDARRFARLVVSEIKLYNEAKVTEGRRNRDIYERLKEDIERGRQMYIDRVPAQIRESTNYFVDELVRILAGGDPSALGPM